MLRQIIILITAGGWLAACQPQSVEFASQFVAAEPTLSSPPTQSWAYYPPGEAAQAEALLTPSPVPTATLSPTWLPPLISGEPFLPVETVFNYYAQSGDTLPAVARRFNVTVDEIHSPEPLPATGLIQPGQLLMIPNPLGNIPTAELLLPDSEVIFSATASDFDVAQFVNDAGGYLSQHVEWSGRIGWMSGADMVRQAALENSINPRLLLALIEYQSGWVYKKPEGLVHKAYPLGLEDMERPGLWMQLKWAIDQLSDGYYGWRSGRTVAVNTADGEVIRLPPGINAGTAALLYFFGQAYGYDRWMQVVNPGYGFVQLYQQMFGDPWERAAMVEPIFTPEVSQPELSLPFERGKVWSLSGGPHGAWDRAGAWGALDFAPSSNVPGCVPSPEWVLASAPGLVVRSGLNTVVIDLDGDGDEQTGWNILYLHLVDIAVQAGTYVLRDTILGHPSCEGGPSTGTHVHVVRKFNGEWIAADGPLPFVLGGWRAYQGELVYDGHLSREGQTVLANLNAYSETFIVRGENDP